MALGKCGNVGDLCRSDAECSGGEICEPPSERTLFVFTNDHGSPTSVYGSPALRGGKETQEEGGMRVGMLAWGPGLGITARDTFGVGNSPDEPIANMIDLFPTFAEIAGHPVDAAGRLPVPPDPNVAQPVDGRSILGLLQNGTSSQERDFVYSNYQRVRAVMSREGVYGEICDGQGSQSEDCHADELATHVCGFEIDGQSNHASLPGARGPVRAASCTPCDPNAAVSECAGVGCEVLGRVCVPDAAPEECTMADKDPLDLVNCPVDTWRRCRSGSDCLSGESCSDARVNCSTITTNDYCRPSSWKIRLGDNQVSTFFDIASNPEEDDKQFSQDPKSAEFGTDGRLNCLQDARDENDAPADSRLGRVLADLQCRIDRWSDCVADQSSPEPAFCDEDGVGGPQLCSAE